MGIQPQRDLTRFVKWPKYIRIQRQKRILMQRLKVPPSIAQFANTVDKSQSANLLKLLSKYSPETKRPRTTDSRLLLTPMPRPEPSPSSSSSVSTTLPNSLKTVPPSSFVIAHDVDPIEIMCFLPTLCRKKSVTYCFVRGKAALGRLVHQKTATCVALCGVNREDLVDFEKLTTQFNIQFNEDEKMRRTWGGGIMGIKNVHMMAAREKIRMIEQTKKETML